MSACDGGRSGMGSGCHPSGLEGTGKQRPWYQGGPQCQKPRETWGLPAVTSTPGSLPACAWQRFVLLWLVLAGL